MDKTLAGIMAVVGALTPLSAAKAEVSASEVGQAMAASSFADLLQPIPNAAAILKVADEQGPVTDPAGVQLAQFYHHHHHHHRYYYHHHHYRWRHHHHHHHFYY